MNKNITVKNKLIMLGWITGLLFFITLVWLLFQPLQVYYLSRSINGVFISSGETRRVTSYAGKDMEKTSLLGYWYNMHNTTDKLFAFTVFQDGILIPLGAVVSDNGTVSEILPLSYHAKQVFKNLPPGVIQIHINRIEGTKR